MEEKRQKQSLGSIENNWNDKMVWKDRRKWCKITWFAATLTSGFINWNDGHIGYKRVRLLRSKKRQRSIICGLLKVSRKGFEVFFLCVFVCLHRVHAAWNEFRVVPKAKNEVSNHLSHDATLTADLHVTKTLDIAVSFSHVVWRDAFFLILPGIGFTEFGKILFLKYVSRLWVVSERF